MSVDRTQKQIITVLVREGTFETLSNSIGMDFEHFLHCELGRKFINCTRVSELTAKAQRNGMFISASLTSIKSDSYWVMFYVGSMILYTRVKRVYMEMAAQHP